MSSRSDAINCNKVVALTNDLSKCKRFIFDVSLDISCTINPKWCKYDQYSIILQAIASTIACQIGHKYKQSKVCSYIIAYNLYREFSRNDCVLKEPKATISFAGQYIDDGSTNEYSEIIYDSFTYDGFMTIPENSLKSDKTTVLLQYTMRFFLSPALPLAQQMYSARGYEMQTDYFQDHYKLCEKIMNEKVDPEKKYDHLEIYQATHSARSVPL